MTVLISPTPPTPLFTSALHAASNGHGVRLYTALLPYTGEDDRGPFRSWTTAQSFFNLPLSQATARERRSMKLQKATSQRAYSQPHRRSAPLNNVVTAAIAVEVAPPGHRPLAADRT